MITGLRLSPPRRLFVTAVSTLVLVGALAGCGSDQPDDPTNPTDAPTASTSAPDTATPTSTSTPTPSPSDALATALLKDSDFRRDVLLRLEPGADVEPDEDDFVGTCLADLSALGDAAGDTPAADARVTFEELGEPYQTLLFDRVADYDDPATLASRFDAFTTAISGCGSVSTTDDQDAVYDLQVTSRAVDLPGADQALQVDLTGTIGGAGGSSDLGSRYVLARFGSRLSVVGVLYVGIDITETYDKALDLATVQGRRVADLA